MMSEFAAIQAAIDEAAPEIVLRHRSAGILTWNLLAKIEDEIIHEIRAQGKHSPQLINMIRASEALQYPKSDLPVSLEGHGIVPLVYEAIEAAWRRVN